MTEQTDQPAEPAAPPWEPRTVRGVPLHYVVPATTATLGLAALASGGLLAWVGGWILTLGFALAVGAFVRSPWALAAPAGAWALWLLISRIAGADLAQTPLGAAVLFAALGAGAVWLGQNAILPAVAGESTTSVHRASIAEELEALLDRPVSLTGAPASDANLEVDEAIAELLEPDISEAPPRAAHMSPAADDDARPDHESHPEVEAESQLESDDADAPPLEELGGTEDDDSTGHVIEFTALSDPDERRD